MRSKEGLRRSRRWDDEGCFALDYLRSEGDIEPRRALVPAVKAGNPAALDHAALLMSAAVDERERGLRSLRVSLVAIPSHLAWPGTQVTEQLCERISVRLPWLEHRPGVLQRIHSIRSSATSANRPSVAEHLRSLALTAQFDSQRIILVDDVFTFGRVTDSARRLVLTAGATDVQVACLARTRLREQPTRQPVPTRRDLKRGNVLGRDPTPLLR